MMFNSPRRYAKTLSALLFCCLSTLLFGINAVSAASVPAKTPVPLMTHGNGQVTMRFVMPLDPSITKYVGTCVGGGTTVTASSAHAPVIVTGLRNGVFYECSTHAVNAAGRGPESWARATMPTA